jgi:hypothetical protein
MRGDQHFFVDAFIRKIEKVRRFGVLNKDLRSQRAFVVSPEVIRRPRRRPLESCARAFEAGACARDPNATFGLPDALNRVNR